jgi:hypothetical protein
MEEAQWTQGFTWFRPLECNTLRSRESCCITVCIVLFKLGVDLICSRRLPGLLLSKAKEVTRRPGARQVALGWLKTLYNS